ncbi:MAG: hypothetical protein J6A15_04880 [Clostridia bacterium]|nr:hypothetical protein [Clostridia bacterium]
MNSLYSANNKILNSVSSSSNDAMWAAVGMIFIVLLAIGGGIALYCTFLSKKNDGKFKGFVAWLYDVLSFKKMLVEMLLKVTYLIAAIYITLNSIFTLFSNPIVAIILLLVGNLLLRLVYEFALISILTCRNTTEINSNLKKIVSKEEE